MPKYVTDCDIYTAIIWLVERFLRNLVCLAPGSLVGHLLRVVQCLMMDHCFSRRVCLTQSFPTMLCGGSMQTYMLLVACSPMTVSSNLSSASYVGIHRFCKFEIHRIILYFKRNDGSNSLGIRIFSYVSLKRGSSLCWSRQSLVLYKFVGYS